MFSERPDDQGDLIPNWVGEALAFHRDGRPIGRLRAGGAPESLVDPPAPVVIAFHGMIQDALGERGRPVSAVYGERVLSLVPGRLVHVATVVRGRPDHELRASMETATQAIEARWAGPIGSWTGAEGELEGLAADLGPVVARTAGRGQEEVEDPLNVRGIFPVTAIDFEGGRARLKVGVFSSGLRGVEGAYLELSFNRDRLRLEETVPGRALTEEGTVRVGNISAGEASSVACLLEVLAPGRHLVEGTLTFFDDVNNPRHFEVPQREFEVTFPALSMEVPTPRIPVEGSPPLALDEAMRAWRYPASLGGLDVLRTARTVLGTRGMVISDGREEAGPPRVWTVEGRALVGNAPLSVALRVTGGEVRRMELRATSTDPSATAGAIAEMRSLLQEAFFKRWRGQVSLVEDNPRRPRRANLPDTDIDIYVPAR